MHFRKRLENPLLVRGGGLGPHETLDPVVLLARSLVNMDESSFSTSGSNVTAWANTGTGGSAFDLDVIVGTAANLTTTTVNGYASVATAGSAGFESTSGQSISGPITIFAVASMTGDYSASRFLLDSRDQSSLRRSLLTSQTNGYPQMFQGTLLSLGSATGSGTRVWVARFNGDATSNLSVSGVGSATGDAGSHATFDWASLFVDYTGASSWIGTASQLVLFNTPMSARQVGAVQRHLEQKYGA